jgi:hypothetical protein
MNRKKIGSRKAMEIQFNWIFIILVGTIIIIFFVNLSMKYQKQAEREIASDIIGKLSTISSSGKESTNTNQEIKVKDLDLATECSFSGCNNIGCSTEFDFADQGVPPPAWMDIEPIFAPRRLTGDSLIMWSLESNMPYRVSSILYLTTPNYQYVLVYNNDPQTYEFAKKLLTELKKNKMIHVQSRNQSKLGLVGAVGDVFTKYVFLFNPPTGSIITPSKTVLDSKKWDVMYIVPADQLESGTVYYSKLDNFGNILPDESKPAYYIGVPMLIGAIYSDDYSYYSCSVHKILLKYQDLNAIYIAKTKLINEYYTNAGDVQCQFFSSAIVTDSIKSINDSITSYLSDRNFSKHAEEMRSYADVVEGYNENARAKDCAELY